MSWAMVHRDTGEEFGDLIVEGLPIEFVGQVGGLVGSRVGACVETPEGVGEFEVVHIDGYVCVDEMHQSSRVVGIYN